MDLKISSFLVRVPVLSQKMWLILERSSIRAMFLTEQPTILSSLMLCYSSTILMSYSIAKKV